MIKRFVFLVLFAVFAVTANAQSWAPALREANAKLEEADRFLKAAMDAQETVIANSNFLKANTAYKQAKAMYEEVIRTIEQESIRAGWSPSEFRSYGEAQRAGRRADDGASSAMMEMMERSRRRNGANLPR